MMPRTQAELWEMIVDVGQEHWRARARGMRLALGWPAVGKWLAFELKGSRRVLRTPPPANDNAGAP